MKNKHFENCQGSICCGDKNPNWEKETIWCPPEPVCQRLPIKVQQRMKRISAEFLKGKFQDLEGMTFNQLSRSSM